MFRRGFLILAIPPLLATLAYLGVIWIKEWPQLYQTTWAYLINIVLRDVSVYLVLVALGSAVHRSRVPAILLAWFFIFIRAVDSAMMYYGDTLLESHHLSMIRWSMLNVFVIPSTIFALIVLILVLLLAAWTIRKHGGGVTFAELLVASVIACVIHYVDFPNAVFRRERMIHVEYVTGLNTLNQRLKYISSNSVVNVISQIVWAPTRGARHVDDLAQYKEVLNKYGLPLGPRKYPPLRLRPFKRVIVVHCESLSLDLLGGYNLYIPKSMTPFFASDFVRSRMITTYFTSDTPTIPGLTGSFSSHPNWATSVLQQFPQAWVRTVRDAGYKTFFIRSASESFGRANILFRRAGLDNMVGREYFESKPELAPLISGLGVCDRIMLDHVIEVMKEHRDEKIYISCLTADTHEPGGRMNYGTLPYPDPPPWFTDGHKPQILQAVQRADFDLKRFLLRIESEGLWNDETMIIITADHAHPLDPEVEAIEGYPREALARATMAILTTQPLPPMRPDLKGCQMDLGPTILHMMDLPIPEGLWGESLFYSGRRNTVIGFFTRNLYLETGGQKWQIDTTAPEGAEEEQLVDLFNSFFVHTAAPAKK